VGVNRKKSNFAGLASWREKDSKPKSISDAKHRHCQGGRINVFCVRINGNSVQSWVQVRRIDGGKKIVALKSTAARLKFILQLKGESSCCRRHGSLRWAAVAVSSKR
jgi:hypothetical protein